MYYMIECLKCGTRVAVPLLLRMTLMTNEPISTKGSEVQVSLNFSDTAHVENKLLKAGWQFTNLDTRKGLCPGHAIQESPIPIVTRTIGLGDM